jgi:hypothetical protein
LWYLITIVIAHSFEVVRSSECIAIIAEPEGVQTKTCLDCDGEKLDRAVLSLCLFDECALLGGGCKGVAADS